MTAPILSGKLLERYVFDRKLIPHDDPKTARVLQEEQLTNLKRIVIHNAYLAEELAVLKERPITPYIPKESLETHFLDAEKGTLHLVNSLGTIRFERELRQAEYLKSRNENIEIELDHYGGSKVAASIRFDAMAHEKNRSMMADIPEEALRSQGGIYLIAGPHSAGDHASIVKDVTHPYLDHRILDVQGKQVIHVDYLFGDQAKTLLAEAYRLVGARHPDLPINLFHYGKMALLAEQGNINDIVLPMAAIDEKKLLNGHSEPSPLYNDLARPGRENDIFEKLVGTDYHVGTTVNTSAVMNQTLEGLTAMRDGGGAFLDMELLPILSASLGSTNTIKHYFSGIVSDKPLSGKTLANNDEYDAKRLRTLFDAYLGVIREI